LRHNVGIIGAGLIGKKRASVLNEFHNCHLIVTADIDRSAAESLAQKYSGETESDWQKVIRRKDIDIVVVATYNKFLAPICVDSLKNGKHVLCEKPLGRNAKESEIIFKAAIKSKVILKTGFNHRHHPAIKKAKKLVESGAIGNIYYIRCIYGHGGRPGYEKEWRSWVFMLSIYLGGFLASLNMSMVR